MPLLSDFIEKGLIENTSESSNVSQKRWEERRAMVFPQPGMQLTKELNDAEELKDNVTFNLSSINNKVNEGGVHSSFIYLFFWKW